MEPIFYALSACYWLLVIDFYLEAEVLDHTPDLGGRLAWRGEVAVHEDGVGWVEGQWLQAAQVIFPASSNAEFGAGVEKPEEAEDFQAALRR